MQQSTPKGAYYLFLGNASSALIMAISTVVVGRLLGPSDYGLYSLVLVIPTYSYLLIHFGMSTASTRFASKYSSEGQDSEARFFIYSMACFQILLSVITILILLPFSDFIASRLLNRLELGGYVIPIAMLSLLGQTIMYVGFGGFTGLGQFRRTAVLLTLQSIVRLFVSVSLVVAGFSFVGAVAGYSAGFVSAGALALLMIISMNKRMAFNGILSNIKTSLSYSIPVYLASLASGLISPLLITFLALGVTNREIGGYSVVVSISSIMLIFSYPITSALLPLFSRTSDRKELAEAYRTTVRYSALFVVPIVAFVMFYSSPIITVIFGGAYSFAGIYLTLFSVYYLLAGVGSTAYVGFLNGTGKTREFLFANGAGFVLALTTAIPLIHIMGVFGAITSFVIGNSLTVTLGNFMVRRQIQENLGILGLWRTYAASFVAAILSYTARFLPTGPTIASVIGGIIFLVCIIPVMVIFGALRKRDMANIQGYYGDVKSLSLLLRIATRYFNLFQKWARP